MRAAIFRFSRGLFACAALLMAASVAAQAPAGAPAASQNTDAVRRNFAEIREAGALRVGVHLLLPYAMRDSAGALMGAEIDVATRLAKDIGIEPDFRIYAWDALIPALQRGEIDLIATGMSITPQRALAVWFSDPYASSGVTLATNTQLTREFASLSDLNSPDVAIGVLGDSVSEQVAHEVFERAAIKRYSAEAEVEQALVKGQLHAYVRSEPAPRFLALRHPKIIDVPLSKPLLETREAFAVRQGDADFINFLNAWIVAREADSWLASTRRYWFESLGWQDKVAQ